MSIFRFADNIAVIKERKEQIQRNHINNEHNLDKYRMRLNRSLRTTRKHWFERQNIKSR